MRTSKNDYKRGLTITYEEYIYRIKRLSNCIKQEINVYINEIVPIIIPNLPESRILIYALNILGVTVYPINPMLSSKVLSNIIEENSISTIFVFEGFWDKFSSVIQNSIIKNIVWLDGLESLTPLLRKAMRKSKTIPTDKRIKSYTWLFNTCKETYVNPYYSKDHIAVIIGTSGTTGTSKGVCLTDDNLNNLAIGQAISDHYRPGEIALDILIQSIGYGISTAHSFGVIGCHTILIPELVTDKLPQLMCTVKPNTFPGGPVHYINLAHSIEFKTNRLPIVRTSFSGGATLDKDVERILNNADIGFVENEDSIIRVRQGYGSTECGGAATANTFGAYKFGSIGIPMANVVVSIFKTGTDQELKYGEEGEICVCGPTVMSGYLNNRKETENVLKRHSDGKIWLHQADLGWCDEDGHFFMTDRIKNIFMRNGFNVHPSKIAEFIMSLPYIKDCIVVGVPHPREQMVPIAFCILNQEYVANDALKVSLNKECLNNLSETDIPFEWIFVDELPRNMDGKVDTTILINNYINNK